MNKIISFNKIVFLVLIFFLAIIMNNYSFASTNSQGFEIFDNAPRMTVKTNTQTYDDVVISFRDFSSLDESKIVFYTAENGQIGQKITDNNFIKDVKKNYGTYDKSIVVDIIYTISNEYLNKKTNEFYVVAADKYNTPRKLEAFFRIKSNGQRYTSDTPPRVQNWKYSKGKCSFVLQDWVGVNYVRLYDMYGSDPSKVVLEKKGYSSGNHTVSFSLSNFTEIKDRYCIKIITQDNNKVKKQTATRVVKFGILNSSISLDKTKISLGVGKEAKLVASTDDSSVKWSSSNTSIATVNNGVVKGIKSGTAIITATISNGQTAKCTVTVKGTSSSSTKTTSSSKPASATNKSTSGTNSSTSIDYEFAKNVSSRAHAKEHENLKWHGSTVGKHAGMIGAYVEAINILNRSNHTLKEVYNLIIQQHPEQKYKNVPVYENTDINNHYHIKVSRDSASVKNIKKALDEGKIVAEIVNTTKWRNEKGKLFGKTGRHTGLIFYFDGKYYHMKTTVVKDGLYTEQQLKEWLGNTSTKLIIYSKKQ